MNEGLCLWCSTGMQCTVRCICQDNMNCYCQIPSLLGRYPCLSCKHLYWPVDIARGMLAEGSLWLAFPWEVVLLMKTNLHATHYCLFSLVVHLRGVPMSLTALVLWASALMNIEARELCLYSGVMFGLFFEICPSFLIRKLSGEHQEGRHSFAAEKRPGLLTRSPWGLPNWPAAECTRGWQPQASEPSLPSTSVSDSPGHLGAQQPWGVFPAAMTTLESLGMLLFHRADTDHKWACKGYYPKGCQEWARCITSTCEHRPLGSRILSCYLQPAYFLFSPHTFLLSPPQPLHFYLRLLSAFK